MIPHQHEKIIPGTKQFFPLGDAVPPDELMAAAKKIVYQLGDDHDMQLRRTLGFRSGVEIPLPDGGKARIMAVYANEKRPPRAGEWYLSGAIVNAYRAPNDLSSSHHIAKLTIVKTTTVTTCEEIR